VAPHTIASGLDLTLLKRLNLSFNYLFTGRVPLNDANSVYAASYHLLGGRIEYRLPLGNQWSFRLSGGADNLLDETYSLGNDINGFGGRYFNAALPRNYYVGLKVQWEKNNPGRAGTK
ncbi:MAG: TonB-dependent receptor, partial [Flavisolibacter sp.]